jgi:hypothetical protein
VTITARLASRSQRAAVASAVGSGTLARVGVWRARVDSSIAGLRSHSGSLGRVRYTGPAGGDSAIASARSTTTSSAWPLRSS